MSKNYLPVLETLELTVDLFGGGKEVYNSLAIGYFNPILDLMRERADKDGAFTIYEKDNYLFEVLPKGMEYYKYGFAVRNKGEQYPILWIYIARKVGDNYPILCKFSSRYLHLSYIVEVLEELKVILNNLFSFISSEGYKRYKGHLFNCKVSRFDICIHNKVFKIEDYFPDYESLNTKVVTKVGLNNRTGKRKVKIIAELNGDSDYSLPYIMFMGHSAGLRMYKKIQEVIEQRTKTFFIPYWKDEGLINELEYRVYDRILKLCEKFDDYRTMYLLAHIIECVEDKKEIEHAMRLLNSRMSRDNLYMEYMCMIKKHKIELIPEIVNIEYQIRSDYIRTIRILDKESGEIIDFTNIEQFILHIDKIYEYLTNKTFRIINPKSKNKRKREKTTDKNWKDIQKLRIKNIVKGDYEIDLDKLKCYKEYARTHDTRNVVKRWISNASSMIYHTQDNITLDDINSFDYQKLLMEQMDNVLRDDENFLLLKYGLAKKVKSYGSKAKEKIDREEVKKIIDSEKEQKKITPKG